MRLIPVEAIIQENVRLTGNPCAAARRRLVEGCYSSFHYYDTAELRIASIVASLVKGHFFVDGNKRTALSTYLVLVIANDLDFIRNPEEQARVLVELAGSKMTGPEIADRLFPAT